MQRIAQTINIASVLFILGAIVKAIFDAVNNSSLSLFDFILQNPTFFLLALFILIFKIKTAIDDNQHFSEPYQDTGSGYRHFGLILALISWVLLGVAGNFITKPERSAEFIIISLVVSTAWLAVHLIEIARDKNKERTIKEIAIAVTREKWVLFNAGYIIILGVFRGWIVPVVKQGSETIFYFLFALLLFDYITSRAKSLAP